ncbi:MAG TPA: hypothetical protein VFE47_03705 [Tepidisphaeraceae bacterium]|jgi:hypothetical protein|nr:hypothetical protein [Tepidisphaeraceae bacterium]
MKPTSLFFGLLFLATPAAFAQQPAPLINPTGKDAPSADAPGDLPANATVDQILDALDQRGQTLREFTAKVSLTSGDKFVEGVSTQVGQVSFQKKGDDDGRLHVVFVKRVDSHGTRDEKGEVLLDKGWVIERDYRKKAETDREIVKPGEKVNLLKLGEGPFPLLIGQKKEDVHKLFDVTLIPPAKGDPADTVHLRLVPKPGTRFSKHLEQMDMWVSRRSKFPVRVDTVGPDDSDPRSTKLEDVKINPEPGLKPGDFDLPKIDKNDWSLHTEPYRE